MKINYIKDSDSEFLSEKFGISDKKAEEIRVKVLEALTTNQQASEMIYSLVNKLNDIEEVVIGLFWLGELFKAAEDLFLKISRKPTNQNQIN